MFIIKKIKLKKVYKHILNVKNVSIVIKLWLNI